MRKGFNPNKNQKISKLDFFHQVIIPVYIPNSEGYFKDSFKILQLHLESLFKTTHAQTFFTIINNGSSKKVQEYLDKLFADNKIHEIIHTENIGKLNAILKGISGHNFPLITISDADVFFLNNWQKATYDVFENFSKTGFVGLCPIPKLLKYKTYNIIVSTLFSKKVKFTNVKNPVALKEFAHSIGNPLFFNNNHLKFNLTVENNGNFAIIGGGHFVGTYRNEVFKSNHDFFTEFSLGGDSEESILDDSIVKSGYWRLTTQDNYANHMGNTYEDWMIEKEKSKRDNQKVYKPKLHQVKFYKAINLFQSIFFYLFISRNIVWKKYLKMKGLPKDAISNY